MSEIQKSVPRVRATLHDVAQAAGVSPTTVSLVLAGKASNRRISEQTHQRVHGAAERLGYTPNLLHRSMRRGRTHVISFYNSFRNREWSDLYMDRLSAGVEHAGGEFGYDVLVHCNYRRDAMETYNFLNGGFADGLILFGPVADDPLLPLLRMSSLPTVLIGPREEESSLSFVQDDEREGIRSIVEALVKNGHRDIVFVGEVVNGQFDPTGRSDVLERELQFALPNAFSLGRVAWTGEAPATIDRIFALPKRPTAICVWHDRIAYRLTEALESRGISIPGELSIIGYDGLLWPSTTGHVVASVNVALDAMGLAAVELLDRLIQGEQGPLSKTVPVQFHPGTTLAAPARP